MPPVDAFQRMKPEQSGEGYAVTWEDVPLMQFDWLATVPLRQKEFTAECDPISVTLQAMEFVNVARLTFEFPYRLFQTVQLTTGSGSASYNAPAPMPLA